MYIKLYGNLHKTCTNFKTTARLHQEIKSMTLPIRATGM